MIYIFQVTDELQDQKPLVNMSFPSKAACEHELSIPFHEGHILYMWKFLLYAQIMPCPY